MTALRIGARGSLLSVTQTSWVAEQIRAQGVSVEIKTIKTTGDKIVDVPLAKIGGKGLFVKEIEEALLSGEIDLAVHSMKDMPTKIPEGLHIGAVPKRENPYDALITRDGVLWKDLPFGARIGTASLRRQSQLKRSRPDLLFFPLRGNLDTRLKKLFSGTSAANGEMDAIVLAAAGLHRMGWKEKITEYLPAAISLPAIGQGALAIECRKDDAKVNAAIAFLNDSKSAAEIAAERALMIRLEGGCQTPIAGFALESNGEITLEGVVLSLDGTKRVHIKKTAPVACASDLGETVGEMLLAAGADVILREILDQQE
ncbi:MAG: hydroxymethylbilane synthase [Nitrospirota bacterium]